MSDAYLCDAVRTPIGRFRGALKDVRADDLAAIPLGDVEISIAGGVESMTRAPFALPKPAEGFPSGKWELFDTSLGWRFPNPKLAERFPLEAMGETAENIATRSGIP